MVDKEKDHGIEMILDIRNWKTSCETNEAVDCWKELNEEFLSKKRVQFKKIFQLKNDFQVYNLILIETDSWIRDGVHQYEN